MKRLIAILLTCGTPSYAGLITHNDYASGATITASGQNSNENTIYNEFNGNIDDNNIKASANVTLSKLAPLAASQLVGTTAGGVLSTTVSSFVTASSITVTGSLTAANIIFSPSIQGITGTLTNDNANVGVVGESSRAYTSAFNTFTNNTNVDLNSFVLTPGDWDITAMINYNVNPAATTLVYLCIATIAGNDNSTCTAGDNYVESGAATVGNNNPLLVISNYRASISNVGPVRYYLKGRVDFSSGTPAIFGARMSARRIR